MTSVEKCRLCFQFEEIFGTLQPLPENTDPDKETVRYCRSCYMRIWRMTYVDEPLYPRKYSASQASHSV